MYTFTVIRRDLPVRTPRLNSINHSRLDPPRPVSYWRHITPYSPYAATINHGPTLLVPAANTCRPRIIIINAVVRLLLDQNKRGATIPCWPRAFGEFFALTGRHSHGHRLVDRLHAGKPARVPVRRASPATNTTTRLPRCWWLSTTIPIHARVFYRRTKNDVMISTHKTRLYFHVIFHNKSI